MASSVGSVLALLASAWLSFKSLSKALEPMVSMSAGVLLGTSLLHLLPEALDRGMDYHVLFRWLLAGLLLFFVLEKFALLRHSHHHEHDGHDHHHGFDKREAGKGGSLILIGDSIHSFADGLLIASAFLIDVKLGLLTTAAIALHEIPQQTGDFLVLINAGIKRKKAFLLMALSGTCAVVGALLGYSLLKEITEFLPYALVLAASSFLYVAVADLIPHMQQRLALKEGFSQLILVSAGVVLVSYLSTFLHHHPH
ncbi:MAG: ZIP family metal transporter [Limnobacter sp.]|nr:ZIP family metal transporter [Limnobacter sp.]